MPLISEFITFFCFKCRSLGKVIVSLYKTNYYQAGSHRVIHLSFFFLQKTILYKEVTIPKEILIQ